MWLCCLAMIPAAAQTNQPARLLEVSIEIVRDTLYVNARVNDSKPLRFKLDTGFGITTINPAVAENLGLQRAGRMTIVGIAGEEEAATYSGASFDLGGAAYSPRRVAALPSEGRRRWNKRDGILGAGFFRRFVVEIDSASKTMRLHEPRDFNYSGPGVIVPVKFKADTPIIDAAIVPVGREAVAGEFEVDTGCDDFVCLGQDFVTANRLGDDSNSSGKSARRGVGGAADIHRTRLAELRIGKLTVDKPSANLFLEGSPAGRGLAGHIGWRALERFKVIFDYSRKQLILEPRS
jgi:predicted aspartyl protease